MSICKCGCGLEAQPGKQFLPGHWSKYNSQLKNKKEKLSESRIIQPPSPEPVLRKEEDSPLNPTAPADTFKPFHSMSLQESKKWWMFWKNDKVQKEIVSSPLELKNQKLPKWAISEAKPHLFNPKKRKRLTQLVFHSRRPPYQEFMWVDTDELVVSVGHKGFKLPSAIHSGIVHWDADNDTPLLTEFAKQEGGEVDIDPETGEIVGDQSQTALKTGMIKNYYFMLGKLANLKGLFTNAGLIMLLQIVCVIAIIALGYLIFKSTEGINNNLNHLINITEAKP